MLKDEVMLASIFAKQRVYPVQRGLFESLAQGMGCRFIPSSEDHQVLFPCSDVLGLSLLVRDGRGAQHHRIVTMSVVEIDRDLSWLWLWYNLGETWVDVYQRITRRGGSKIATIQRN